MIRGMIFVFMLLLMGSSYAAVWDQAKLERFLYYSCVPSDFDDEDTPIIPYREMDSLRQYNFSKVFAESGWTTNELISQIFTVITNNLKDVAWEDERQRAVVYISAQVLKDCNHPIVTNLFASINETDIRGLQVTTIPAMFQYSHLEPEIFTYLKRLCVMTNIYAQAASSISFDLLECLGSLPDDEKQAATNRVARYMYFANYHLTDDQGWEDQRLAKFIPAYSNSIQRLDFMQHVVNTATNLYQRTNALNVVNHLLTIPTNELNNISWITEDCAQ